MLQSLSATAARAIRLRATGNGMGPKPTPRWIKATTDFTVTGIAAGSTTVGIDAPCLRSTACDQLPQFALWGEKPDPDDTALDFAAAAINEAMTAGSAGNYFDDAVLSAILKLVRSGCASGVTVELCAAESKQNGFAITSHSSQDIEANKKSISPSRAFIVSGNLEEVQHCSGYFRLIVKENTKLLGRLANPSLHLDRLHSLWGEKVTLEGMVNFKGNRTARLIDVRKIRRYVERDAPFEKVPKGDPSDARELIVEAMSKKGATKLTDLIGIWPGDETAEELIAELKGEGG